MNISQAGQIFDILLDLPKDHEFWGKDYTKADCFNTPFENLEEWYTREKQYHWAKHYRRDIIDKALAELSD